MAEARAEAARPTERAAAAEALAIARQASDEAGEGVGETATGALRTRVRRAESRCEATAGVTDADAAEALWRARCALAVAPRDLGDQSKVAARATGDGGE